ncbi:hypothetical protein [Thalassospira alkalitolerans]|uniref:Uncharacterized protein n=1 Tax=Thalassospira alkalitolerans TaxID=1293890 RepID=A0A1Y2LEH3_9PROT|nr:hypothetical protein [Thalassospira alkalitolerans]OSQ49063.1 hypothetical protein TALK_05495 [Thalassospira alkalitolerans]
MAAPDWPGRIVGDDGHDRIAACLVMDIQNAPDWARVVLGHVDDVINGRVSHQDVVMNAYILKIDPAICEIAPAYEEHGEDVVWVPTAEFRAALVAWIDQIDNSPD